MSTTSVAFGNIRNRPLMRRLFVRQDTEQLFDMVSGVRRVVMGCEIGPRMYNLVWHRRAKKRGMRTFFAKKDIQMSVDTRGFKVHEANIRRAHEGRRLTSPARFTATVKGEVLTGPDAGQKEAYEVSHKVSGAWNRKKKRNKQWRQARWVEHVKEDRDAIVRTVDVEGYNLIKAEDTNNIELVEYHPRQVVVKKAGLIQCVAIPAPGYEVRVRDREAEHAPKGHSDHPFVSADVEFVRTDA